MLRHELMSPQELLRLYLICRKWSLARGLSGYVDLKPHHDESAASLALLLSMTTVLGGPPESDRDWLLCFVSLGIAMAYLLLLSILYLLIQCRVAHSKRLVRHYGGRAGHAASTQVVGGFCLGFSNSDHHVPGGRYQWVAGCSRLAEDTGYGFILLG